MSTAKKYAAYLARVSRWMSGEENAKTLPWPDCSYEEYVRRVGRHYKVMTMAQLESFADGADTLMDRRTLRYAEGLAQHEMVREASK